MTEHRLRKVVRMRTRLADEVYEQLFASIISGHTGPGDRLIQEKIAEEIDVSRTPVREALLRLEREGIIRPAGKRGFEVCELTEKEVRDAYQAREAIEGMAARLLAGEDRPEALQHIAEAIGRASEQRHESIEAAYRANEAVHRAIVEASGNTLLVELFDVVWGRQMAVRLYAELFNEVDLVSGFAHDHTSLLEALRGGDPDRAFEAVTEHIRDGLELQLLAMSERSGRMARSERSGRLARSEAVGSERSARSEAVGSERSARSGAVGSEPAAEHEGVRHDQH